VHSGADLESAITTCMGYKSEVPFICDISIRMLQIHTLISHVLLSGYRVKVSWLVFGSIQ
jgi:hypothetical protein